MRVNCKGINRVTKRLADGTSKTFYYAWKSGPRISGEYGSPEFIASYMEACAQKRAPAHGVVLSLLRLYESSGEYQGLAPRTRSDYVKQIKLIERNFGDFPLTALSDRRTRAIFMGWRDELSTKSRRQADYA